MADPNLFAASVPLTMVALVFAGCLEDQQPAAALGDGHGHTHGMLPMGHFAMEAQQCEEGGFTAVYPMNAGATRNGTWVLEDIRAEVGNPLRDGYGRPLTGVATGNWHQGYRCVSAASADGTQKEFLFGWIGNMIKPPAWDEGGADVHFLLAGLGLANGSIAEGLRATTNAAISHAYDPTRVTWYVPKEAPRSAVHAIYSDAEKGIYTSYSTLHKYRDVPERTLRLWWQVPTDGSQAHATHDHMEAESGEAMPTTWHPVYWDLKTSGGPQWTTPPVDSPEIACHLGNDDHSSSPTGRVLGGACQPTLTTVYHHKSIEFHSGKVYTDITLDKIWIH